MSESHPDTVARMVAQAKEHVENLPLERVAAEIEGGGVILIDIREEDERLLEGPSQTRCMCLGGCWNSRPIRPVPSLGRSSIPKVGSSSTAPREAVRRWERILSSGWATGT
jgi:hypothetical protein